MTEDDKQSTMDQDKANIEPISETQIFTSEKEKLRQNMIRPVRHKRAPDDFHDWAWTKRQLYNPDMKL